MGGEESEANPSPQPPVNNFTGVEALRFNRDRIWEEFVISMFLAFPLRQARSANDQPQQRL